MRDAEKMFFHSAICNPHSAFNKWGGKSELYRTGWSLTGTGSDSKESATENIPPMVAERLSGKGEKVG